MVNFPTSIDTLTNPLSTDTMVAVPHHTQHANANDAIEALEAKVGADSSGVTSSHDYKIAQRVVGPASATNNDIAVYDSTTGKLIKDGGATIAQVRDRTTHTGTQNASTVTVTTRNIGNSTSLDTFLGNIDESATSQSQSGFLSWSGAGNYYSLAANQLTLLRGGTGYIKGKKITWVGSQTTATLTNHSAHWVYIDSTGTIGMTTTRTEALYHDNIILFEIHYNAVDIEVVIENHSYEQNTSIGHLLHEEFGTVLTPIDGTNIIGADITRVATGTGGAVGDRQIKLVGSAMINDQGLQTSIPDSGGAAITYKFYYKDNLGQWTEYASQTQFPMVYNNAGTITALATSGATDVGLFTVYAVKAEPNSGLPIYIAVINNAVFGTDAAALASISASTNEIADGTLFQALEPAQLGYVVVTNNVSGGYLSIVQISKATARSGTSGGAGATTASGVSANTANFDGYLSASDTNVQVALDNLDRIGQKGADIASASTTDLSTATGNYVHITGSTTINSFGTLTAGNLRHIVFDGSPIVTHNATSLILPGEANIQTSAGDVMLLRSEGGGNWKCVTYSPTVGLANRTLSNLGTTAINTSLVSDTDNTDDLGTTVKKWANLFITNIGATATRITKGWFTDIESTNMPTVGGISLATTFAGGNATQNIGYLNIPQNSQSAAYTTVLADSGKHILHPIADNNARTFTIDSNANVAYPIGTAITFINLINTVTIAITSDTMYLGGTGTTGSRTLAAYGVATATKVGTTTWVISGNGLT